MNLRGSDDARRLSLGIGPSSDEAVGPRREFARRFAKGIGKLAGNTLGVHWKKTKKTYRKNAGGYRIGGIFTIFGCVQKLQSTPTHLQSRHLRLLYRWNHRTTSHSERFIRYLLLPFLHHATILSNRIYESQRRILPANLQP
ncbi:hypothetical protein B296_00002390 [Ensete ventricosum]|uniref:Uncharacterized protein n=1 Tax=Ensete ventricosum TaxID=4639 RepID=A0A427AFW3_ENSVE|nr:hypothetical protein B296_00002390 [Ensete ventricosum]